MTDDARIQALVRDPASGQEVYLLGTQPWVEYALTILLVLEWEVLWTQWVEAPGEPTALRYWGATEDDVAAAKAAAKAMVLCQAMAGVPLPGRETDLMTAPA